jgi:hypothetical protein
MLLRLATALTLAIFAWGSQAQAAPVTFSYDGVIWHAGSGWQVGDTFQFSFTFEDSTPDAYPSDPHRGSYVNAITHFTFTSQNLSFTAGPSDFVNPHGFPTNSQIDVHDLDSTSGSGALDEYDVFMFIAGQPIDYFDFRLRSLDLTTFTSDALPTSFLSAAHFDITPGILGSSGGAFFFVNDPIVPTPIPAALPLLLSALGGFALIGWRKRRSEA